MNFLRNKKLKKEEKVSIIKNLLHNQCLILMNYRKSLAKHQKIKSNYYLYKTIYAKNLSIAI